MYINLFLVQIIYTLYRLVYQNFHYFYNFQLLCMLNNKYIIHILYSRLKQIKGKISLF